MNEAGTRLEDRANENRSAPGGIEVIILPATWRDLNAVRRLEHVCFPLDAWPLFDLIGVLTFPNMVRLKAMVDDEMVGFIAGERKPGNNTGWVATVGVLPEYRRMGIARRLMRHCEEGLGGREIKLCVRKSNTAAQQMYLELGYLTMEVWPKYYRDGEDAYVMQKKQPTGGNGL